MTVTSPKGFRACGVRAGLKSVDAPDMALVVNEGDAPVGAGVFTTNRVVAAPVTWSRTVCADGSFRAVILNSGGANACTGDKGYSDSQRSAELVAQSLGCTAQEVAVCSTGLIGELLDMGKVEAGITAAVDALSSDGGADASEAIRTTDTVAKTVAISAPSGFTVGGMAKGAGMLAPGLATMLCVITTDARISAQFAQEALNKAVSETFERVDSDGCMSTNDTVILMASGASGIDADEAEFEEALNSACADLARKLVADAEGASHDISIRVVGATNDNAALNVARAVARSNLFKAAIFGNDPNWGRILSAVGTVPEDVAPYDPAQVDVSINGVMVCRSGGVGEDRTLVDLSSDREVHIVIDLHAGSTTLTVWTNDLTLDYVRENSEYST